MKFNHASSICKLVLCLALAACGGSGGGGDSDKPKPLAECSVTLHGDSMIDAPLIEQPALVLKKMLPKMSVLDLSVQGTSLDSLMKGYPARYVERLQTTQPAQAPFLQQPITTSIVVLEHGGIDALELKDLVNFEAQLRQAINHVRTAGKMPILTGIVPLANAGIFGDEVQAHRKKINEVIHKVAVELVVPHTGWNEDESFVPSRDTLDGIHRTQVKSDYLTGKLVASIIEVLPHCK
jgi:hypothetical protein